MYPVIRALLQVNKARQKEKLTNPFEETKVYMRVMPWDLDLLMELNNGRFLTLMDIGRYDMGERIGLPKLLKKKKWGLMVAAVNARYRRRLKVFEKFTLHTKMTYFDERWFYFHQWFSSDNESKIHASFLVRTAVTSKKGLVPTAEVIDAMGYDESDFNDHNHQSEWISQWVESDEIHKEIMEQKL